MRKITTIKVLKVDRPMPSSFVTHYFILSKMAPYEETGELCRQNVVFKTIIMVEITDSRILQHVKNRTYK